MGFTVGWGRALSVAAAAALVACQGAAPGPADAAAHWTTPYTYGDWLLQQTRQRLRVLAAHGDTQFVVASIGDSWTHFAPRWAGPAATALKAAYGDAGGGWSGFGFGGPNGAYVNGNVGYPSLAVLFPNAADWSYAGYNVSASPDIASLASSIPGASVSVVNGPAGTASLRLFALGTTDGVVRYRWNGGAWISLGVTGVGLLLQELTYVPAIPWRLDIEVASGSVRLLGLDARNASPGVRWHKLAGTGSRAAQWAAAGPEWEAGIAALTPDLVIIFLGTNDQAWYEAVTFKGHVQRMIDRIRVAVPAADILLVAPPENQLGRTVPMQTLQVALHELAVANACAFLNLQPIFGAAPEDYAAGSSRPWFEADGVHPSEVGGRAIADAILRLLAPPQ